jgi:S-formylglutathione hydrolase FrmB
VRPLLLTALAVVLLAAPANAARPDFHDAGGLRVTTVKELDARLRELTVTTPALQGPAKIRVLLPTGYDPRRRYPVLYLLHGTSGGADDWTEQGDAEKTTADKPLIVVMPDIALNDDGGGWCTDWYNGGAYGPPKWETFHIGQVIPWVDANLPTIATREGRAIAGLSQGGFCATSYASRHPDLFATTISYSGAPDIAWDADVRAGSTAVINATEVGLDGVPPNSMFGDRATQELNYAAHDPATLADPNLRDTRILPFTGNGQPGPLDPPPPAVPNPGTMSIEMLVWRDTHEFHDRLDAVGIAHRFDDYGPGTHTWPYWARDLRETMGPLMDAFAHPPARPARVTYTSADDAYGAYDWRVAMHRIAREFSTLKRASARGFALAGSGSGTVVTPPAFAPGGRYAVRLRGDGIDRTLRVAAGAERRLRIEVPLGPANPYQAETPEAVVAGTKVFETAVTIARARGRKRA